MRKGFTLVETLLVVSILAILLTLGNVILNSFARKDQVLVVAREIEAVINEAKVKTLAGFSLGESGGFNFGVYFQADRYVLFPGIIYDPLNNHNQIFLLPESLENSPIFLPANSVVFEKISGEVGGFLPDQNYLILNDQKSQEKKKISVNKLGVVKVEEF